MDEKKIIKKIRKGDEEALNSLIELLYPQVYRYVYRKLQGDDQSADITQETFIRFVRNISTYRVEGKVLHYLYRIASNLCIDYFRKDIKETVIDIEDECVIDHQLLPNEEILVQMKTEELLGFISKLSSVQQDVVILRYFEELSFKEIAMVLEVSESTLKSRHTLALRRLQIMMRGDSEYERENSYTKDEVGRNKNCMH